MPRASCHAASHEPTICRGYVLSPRSRSPANEALSAPRHGSAGSNWGPISLRTGPHHRRRKQAPEDVMDSERVSSGTRTPDTRFVIPNRLALQARSWELGSDGDMSVRVLSSWLVVACCSEPGGFEVEPGWRDRRRR